MGHHAAAGKQVFAFDFDGTLCDGLNECLLVTWNGYHQLGLEAFGDEGLRNIPEAFAARFSLLRNFSKHLGHFAVALLTESPVETQEQFDRVYEAMDEDQVYDFMTRVTQYRHAARSAFQNEWLAYHAFYPGVTRFLRSSSEPLYVVTAKDAESVQAIFTANNIEIPQHRIFGEQRAKVGALDTIAGQENIDKSQLFFFDDNVFNAIEARRAGYSAYWAGWGYSTQAHYELAARAGMNPMSLDRFVMGGFKECPSYSCTA